MPNKSFIKTRNLFQCLSLSALVLIFAACSKSSDQRAFENRALTTPENYTEMTESGDVVENRTDPDDWQIGPMFQGLIEISQPAYPNPVNLNEPLEIGIEVKGIDGVNGLEILAFRDPDDPDQLRREPLYTNSESPLSTGSLTIRLNPGEFSLRGSGEQASGLYRILIYDGQQNLISYGDVELI